MELHEERDELFELAKSLKLNPPKNISTERLKDLVERARIAHTIKVEEEVRAELQAKAKLKLDIAEIKATAEINRIKLDIPPEPTLEDVIRLQKELNIKKKEPIPSPETIAIEKSKKVYATFHNQEEEELDVKINPGGVYWFHLFDGHVHVIPEWLIGHCNRQAVFPIYEDKPDPVTGQPISVKTGTKRRWIFETHTECEVPKDTPFGVVLDEKVLDKILQPVS